MKVIGWIFVVWLIGSILYSLAFTARGHVGLQRDGVPSDLSNPWGRNMLIIQVVKGIVAFLMLRWLLS